MKGESVTMSMPFQPVRLNRSSALPADLHEVASFAVGGSSALARLLGGDTPDQVRSLLAQGKTFLKRLLEDIRVSLEGAPALPADDEQAYDPASIVHYFVVANTQPRAVGPQEELVKRSTDDMKRLAEELLNIFSEIDTGHIYEEDALAAALDKYRKLSVPYIRATAQANGDASHDFFARRGGRQAR